MASQAPIPGSNATIFFSSHHATHYAFTIGSNHPISYQRQLYVTADHLFQALKFPSERSDIAELVRNSSNPRQVANRYVADYRPDWPERLISCLETVLLLKFNQYPGLMAELFATGDAQLVQLGSDQFWSRQENGQGLNEFGKALMRVRDTLRAGRRAH